MSAHRRTTLAAAAVALCAAAAAPPAIAASGTEAAPTMARTWGVDGRVAALAVSGSTVVMGGQFDQAFSPSGDVEVAERLAKMDRDTGTILPWNVSVEGEVTALAIDGDTVYVGGAFTAVNGQPRQNLAAVSLSTGRLEAWSPSANRNVEALKVVGGDVYVGGKFSSVSDGTGTYNQAYVARISSGGTLDRTWSSGLVVDAPVRSFLPSADGRQIWVGGDFLTVNGVGGSKGARITLVSTGTTPTVDAGFQSQPTNEGARSPVFGMALDGNNLLLAVGGSGGACTLVDAGSGTVRWSHHTNGNAVAAAFLGDYSYCGGHFSGSGSFGGLTRPKLGEVRTATGAITAKSWAINSAQGVFALTHDARTLYLGGDFTKSKTVTQPRIGLIYDKSALTAPLAPGNPLARGGDGQVLLNWDRPSTDGGSPLQRYAVYRANAKGAMQLIGRTSVGSFVDATVTNGNRYTYQVRAENAVGASAPSAQVTGAPRSGVVLTPAAPQDVSATGKLGSAVVSWAAPLSDGGAPVTAYRVFRGTTSGDLAPLADVSASQRSFTDSNVTVGQRYYYQVAAINEAGEGLRSKEVLATPNRGVPGAPTLTADTATANQVTLSWVPGREGASPTTKYILTRDAIRIAVLDGATTDYTDTAVTSGRSYTYQVKAVNSYGASPNSNSVTAVAR